MTNPTELTYIPRRASWFLWTQDFETPEIETPDGADATVTLALPDEGEIWPWEVPGQEIGLRQGWDWLENRAFDDSDGLSLQSWTELAQGGQPVFPVSAHCGLALDGEHIYTADATTAHVRDVLALAKQLPDLGLQTRLRDYQLAGVRWLQDRDDGAVLADDMGLGKTLQTIGLMELKDKRPHLVVCPTSVSRNWENEIRRHSPNLEVITETGSSRTGPRGGARRKKPKRGSVTITTYARLRRNPERFADVNWGVVAFDEAQQIKNPRTLAYRTAATLPADFRLAITGTPVENELNDLWALADLVRPGFLGTRRRFKERYVFPIQQRNSAPAADRLAAHSSELMLRRTKAEVAPDLPPRQVVDIPCSITDEQRRLYNSALVNAFEGGLGMGISRRANVLSLLTKLKQICNHPAQALHETSPLQDRSGKFDRLHDMLDEAVAADTGVLIFTQFTAMGQLLAEDLSSRHGMDVPFLHGGLNADQREEIVETFQSGQGSNILVLSLRAAGFGLNLTRATTVVHYDRWWNPAVEDQASDRAHRIGQEQPVTIYTLRSAGTVEDHIASMQDRKRGLAEAAFDGGDAELLELDDEALRSVLQLSTARESEGTDDGN